MYYITKSTISVRVAPAAEGKIVNILKPNTVIRTIEEKNGWLRTISGQYILKSGYLESLEMYNKRMKRDGYLDRVITLAKPRMMATNITPRATTDDLDDCKSVNVIGNIKDINGTPVPVSDENTIYAVVADTIDKEKGTCKIVSASNPNQQYTVNMTDLQVMGDDGKWQDVELSEDQQHQQQVDFLVNNIQNIEGYIANTINDFANMNIEHTRSVYGMPYQFTPIVDNRWDGSFNSSSFGRKYAEKIVARMPMLIMQAGIPEFLQGYNEDDRNTTYQLLSYLYENPDKGDDDARYCILTKPTYVDDDHKILKTGSAGARYFFLLTGPEGATWKAHLTNEEDFYFSTSTVSDFNHSAEYGNDNGGKVNMVSHGIARAKPYIIQINVRHSWTGVSEDAEGIAVDESGSVTGEYPWYLDEEYLYEEDGDTKSHVDDISDEKDSWWDSDKRSAFWAKYDNEDNSPLKNAFSYFTEWGADMDEKKDLSLISTDFYITVTLADGAEYNLKINPPYEYLDASNKTDTRYKDNRRFAGTDERIRIRHVPAQYMWGYDDLASPELNQHQEDAGLTETYWWQKNEYWK